MGGRSFHTHNHTLVIVSSLCVIAEAVYDLLKDIIYDTTMKGCVPGAVASGSCRALDHIQSHRFPHTTQGSTKELQELHNHKLSEINPHGAGQQKRVHISMSEKVYNLASLRSTVIMCTTEQNRHV